jgi:drug/metabolite transporter (DMT)-like permease
VILLNCSPLFVALLAHWLIPNDRLTFRKVFGLIAAFSGVAVIFLVSIPERDVLIGNLLVLLGGFLLGVIQVYSKFLLRRLNALQIVFWEFAYGVSCFISLSLALESNERFQLTSIVICSVLYQGLVVAGFGFVTWTYLLQRFPASQLASFQFSIPVFGVALGWLLLGEVLTGRLMAGATLVAIGIFVVSTSNRKSD